MLCPDVVGHEPARHFFLRAIAAQRLSHAYLLVGPTGIGKRRFADQLTEALLCRHGPSESCGACASCLQLASGNHPSLTLIAPEPGKGIDIDTIRSVIDTLSLRSREGRVVLIDDADRMNVAAANAVLKVLEEPPPGIVFLLITGRGAHLLPTIHSRCQRVPFRPLSEDEFATALTQLGAASDVFPDLHSAAGGSPGNALRLIEGIEECGGDERFRALLSGAGAERAETLVDYLQTRGSETKRDRVRRLLDLVMEGVWAQRPADPVAREQAAERSLRFSELLRDLDANHNAELVLEAAARLLRPS
ncbi:MAG: DNA polymerase III subunit delta' [Planctomycetota bacterium]